jgi:hypothetical protein
LLARASSRRWSCSTTMTTTSTTLLLMMQSPPDFAKIAAQGRLNLAYDESNQAQQHRQVSTPLLAFESPPRTDTFAGVDAFIQASWECDEGELVLRQDLSLIERFVSGKRVPADTLLAYLAIKVHLEPKDDVKCLLEGYMSALSSEAKKRATEDWRTAWKPKYARLLALYVTCLLAMQQPEAARAALEPHRVDSLLLDDPVRRTLEHTFNLATMIKPVSIPPAAAAAAAAAVPATNPSPPNLPALSSSTWMDELGLAMQKNAQTLVGGAVALLALSLALSSSSARRRAGAPSSASDGNLVSSFATTLANMLFGDE